MTIEDEGKKHFFEGGKSTDCPYDATEIAGGIFAIAWLKGFAEGSDEYMETAGRALDE